MDETSPLYQATPESLKASSGRFMASVNCTDSVLNASLPSQAGYLAEDVHFGQRFVEVYTEAPDGKLFVDYSRLNETELAT